MARIVLNTFGSLGDLHPYLAIALQLQARGHQAVVATSKVYQAKIESAGLEFAPIRPDVGELIDRPDFIEQLWHAKHGTEYLIRDYLVPQVEQSYEDLLEACRNANLLLTHAAAYAGPIVGEFLKMRWISIALQPAVFFSALDPSVVAPAPWLRHLYGLGPSFYRLLLAVAERRVDSWTGPILKLRKRLGLPQLQLNPVTRGHFSPHGTIALFSRRFALPQADWPTRTVQTGFVFYDHKGKDLPGKESPAPQDLLDFLAAGRSPILFTLGSSAVMQAGDFYIESVEAVRSLGERAILLVGPGDRSKLRGELPASVFLAEYMPYSEVMPHVAAIVHQGGIGTTGQSLRAGKPMLVVPWAHDQPDNAERLRKLGVARWISRSSYRSPRVARELKRLLADGSCRETAKEIGAALSKEDGLGGACDAIERFLPPTKDAIG